MSYSIRIRKRYSNLNLKFGSDVEHDEQTPFKVNEEDESDEILRGGVDSNKNDEFFEISKLNKCPYCHETYVHFVINDKQSESSSEAKECQEKTLEENLYFSKSTIEIDVKADNENKFTFNFIDHHKNELLVKDVKHKKNIVIKNYFHFNLNTAIPLSSSSSSLPMPEKENNTLNNEDR